MNCYLVKLIPTSIKALLLFKVLFGKKKFLASCYLKLVEGHCMKTQEKIILGFKKYILAVISFEGGLFS